MTFKTLRGFVLAAGTYIAGCGGGGGEPTPDAATERDAGVAQDNCPSGDNIRRASELSGPCCARVSNADRLGAPEFRLTELSVASPPVLSMQLIVDVVRSFIDEERMVLVMDVDAETEADVAVRLGHAELDANDHFAFVEGVAPTDSGDSERWNAVTVRGTIADETLRTTPAEQTVFIPAFNADGSLSFELPLREFEIVEMSMTEDRTCVGTRESRFAYSTESAVLRTYITVEDSVGRQLVVGPLINVDFCAMLAGFPLNFPQLCTDIDRSEWMSPPDALCDEAGCRLDCDPMTDCNAWAMNAGFSAHGVEIAE